MRKKLQTYVMGFLFLCGLMLAAGCEITDGDKTAKQKDLEFTVVEEADLPEELKTLIDEKKKEPMKLTYSNSEYLYIVAGYGEQRSGGYSITVDELYLTENSIYIKTTLIGPGADEKVTQAATWPYLVVKTELREEPVVFEN